MRLGIGSYTYGWAVGVDGDRPANAVTADELIRRAVAMGVRVVQLGDTLPAATFNPEAFGRLAAKARRHQIELEIGIRGCGISQLNEFIGMAGEHGVKLLRIVIDSPGDEPDEVEVIRRIESALAREQSGAVTLAIENHDRFPAASLARIVQEFFPRVGICLDTVNSLGALEGPELVVDTLGPYAVNLHIKDFAVCRVPSKQGFTIEGRAAGSGMLNIPWLLERLAGFGRSDIHAIAELWVTPRQTIEQTIELESQWAAQSVRALRQWISD